MELIWIDWQEMINQSYRETVIFGRILLLWNGLMAFIVLVVVASQLVEGFATKPRQRHLTTANIHPPFTTKKAPSSHSRKKNPLDTALAEYVLSSSSASADGRPTLLIVDTNNVRGKSDFAIWNCDLLPLLTSLRNQYQPRSEQQQQHLLHIVYVMDHGCRPQVFDYEDGLIVFAGPHRTADDVIAQATRAVVVKIFATKGICADWR